VSTVHSVQCSVVTVVKISEAMVEEDDELREEERNIEEIDDQLYVSNIVHILLKPVLVDFCSSEYFSIMIIELMFS